MFRMAKKIYCFALFSGLLTLSLLSQQADSVFRSGYFSIEEAQIKLVSPNGGEVWSTGEVHEVIWTAVSRISTIRIEYSVDNGKKYEIIAAATKNTGRYSWNIGFISSMNCLVRISDAKDQTSDASDQTFIIKPSYSLSGGQFGEPKSWLSGIDSQGYRISGDVNGDGSDDIMLFVAEQPGVRVYLSDGTKFVDAGIWAETGPGADGWQVGDFDGDGKTDLLRCLKGGSGAKVYLSEGNRFVDAGSWTEAGNGADGWYIGDFNGDIKSDLLRYMPGMSGAEVFLSNGMSFIEAGSWTGAGNGADGWYIGDFNSDGKSDLLRYVPGVSGAELFLSNGVSFVEAGSWTGSANGRKGWFVSDFNGDGRTDLMRFVMDLAAVEVLLSSGKSFINDGAWSRAGIGQDVWDLGDFNGDGRVDLIRTGEVGELITWEVLAGSFAPPEDMGKTNPSIIIPPRHQAWAGDLSLEIDELRGAEELAFLEYLKRVYNADKHRQIFQLQCLFEQRTGRRATRVQMLRFIKRGFLPY